MGSEPKMETLNPAQGRKAWGFEMLGGCRIIDRRVRMLASFLGFGFWVSGLGFRVFGFRV